MAKRVHGIATYKEIADEKIERARNDSIINTQLISIRRDYAYIEELIDSRRLLLEVIPRDYMALVEINNILDEHIEDYAQSRVYI